jgi:hypothetical protein
MQLSIEFNLGFVGQAFDSAVHGITSEQHIAIAREFAGFSYADILAGIIQNRYLRACRYIQAGLNSAAVTQ